jgi:hypothetical protein
LARPAAVGEPDGFKVVDHMIEGLQGASRNIWLAHAIAATLVAEGLCSLATALLRNRDDRQVPEVVQVGAAIALQNPAVPAYVDFMDGNTGNRARSARLIANTADPDNAVA